MFLKQSFAVLIFLSTPTALLGQAVDLSNVGTGDVIDSSTVIPTGAVINLNGGAIATNTDSLNGVTLNVNSGTVGLDIDSMNSVININGGGVSQTASNLVEGFNSVNNTIRITGGDVGSFFQLRGTTTLELSGGALEGFGVIDNASAVVLGGSFNLADINGPLDIFGGDFNTVRAFNGSDVNFFGTEFFLDGVPLGGFSPDGSRLVPERNAVLSGTLTDGSTFATLLDSKTLVSDLVFDPRPGDLLPGFASNGAVLTVNLVATVPEPSSVAICLLAGAALVARRRR